MQSHLIMKSYHSWIPGVTATKLGSVRQVAVTPGMTTFWQCCLHKNAQIPQPLGEWGSNHPPSFLIMHSHTKNSLTLDTHIESILTLGEIVHHRLGTSYVELP